MSFYLKYELSRLVHSDDAKTFQAVQKSTRRNVLLHLVDKAASPALVRKIQALSPPPDGDLLELGEFAGSYFLVTGVIDGFNGLETWLDRRGAEPAARPVTAVNARQPAELRPPTSPTMLDPTPEAARVVPPAGRQDAPGELKRLFGEKSEQTAPAPPPASPRAVPEGDASPPGEFTRLFGEASPPKRAIPPPPAPPPAPPQPMAAPEAPAGEFTRLFGEPGEPPPAPRAKEGPGEVTRRFGDSPPPVTQTFTPPAGRVFEDALSPAPPPRPQPQPPTPPPPPARAVQPPPKETAGEFTRLFGSDSSSTAPTRPRFEGSAPGGAAAFEPPQSKAPAHRDSEAAKEGSGEFTRLFGGGPSSAAPARPGAGGGMFEDAAPPPRPQPKSPAPPGDIQKSSGEFTRLFGPSGKGSPAPKTPAPAAPSPLPSPLEPASSPFGEGPGEFTKMFGNSSARGGGFSGGGDMRRPPPSSFGEGLVGEVSGDEALAPDRPKAKGSKPFRAPGEFTRMFGSSDPSEAAQQEFIPAAREGGADEYASGLFRNPHAEPKRPASPLGAAPGSPGGAPGDYTMTFERQGAAPAGTAAPASRPAPTPPGGAIAPAAPVSSGPSKGMLIALVAAVLVAGLSLGAAIYMFLNRASDDAAAPPAAIEQQSQPPSGGN